MQGLLRKMDALSTLQARLTLACDCHFMYWNRALLPTYFADMYQTPADANNMQARRRPRPLPLFSAPPAVDSPTSDSPGST